MLEMAAIPWLLWILIATGLIAVHEMGHLISTIALGGRITGVHFRGLAVGVGVDLSAIAVTRKAWTLAAGLGAETGMALLGWLVWPSWAWVVCWGLSVLANGVPWWPHNDARRWLALRRAAHRA